MILIFVTACTSSLVSTQKRCTNKCWTGRWRSFSRLPRPCNARSCRQRKQTWSWSSACVTSRKPISTWNRFRRQQIKCRGSYSVTVWQIGSSTQLSLPPPSQRPHQRIRGQATDRMLVLKHPPMHVPDHQGAPACSSRKVCCGEDLPEVSGMMHHLHRVCVDSHRRGCTDLLLLLGEGPCAIRRRWRNRRTESRLRCLPFRRERMTWRGRASRRARAASSFCRSLSTWCDEIPSISCS